MDYSAWAISQLRSGRPLTDIDLGRVTGPFSEYVGICRYLNGGDRREAFDRWVSVMPDAERERIHRAVFAVPLDLPVFPEPADGFEQANKFLVDLPELPAAATLTPAMLRAAGETGAFLDGCADYVGRVVPTMPRYMLANSALTLVSIAVARRLMLPMYFADVYPILWTLIIAESTVFGKTTALNFFFDLAMDTMPELLLSTSSSNDRLIQDMAGIKPVNFDQLPLFKQERMRHGYFFAGQRGVVVDEASSLFGSFEKEYNRGKIETLLKAYDCAREQEHQTNKYGLVWLRHLYMPFLGATTPDSVRFANTDYMWGSGFWPRFILLVPDKPFPDEEDELLDRLPRPVELTQTLGRLLDALPQPSPDVPDPKAPPDEPNQIVVTMSEEALKHWSHYRRALRRTFQNPKVTPDHRLRPMLGRMPVKLLSAAMLLAALDWDPVKTAAPRIEIPHYARAHQMAEEWRESVLRFMDMMNARPDKQVYEQRIISCLEHIKRSGRKSTARELQRLTHWDREILNGHLNEMKADGLLEVVRDGRVDVWRTVEAGQ
jgi:hypothetical protein